MKQVELLAPAGSMENLRAAIYAGADAVYAAGKQFGARAYATNFSEEELREAIAFVHLYGKKFYLTINTLMKQAELDALPAFLLPFYQKGLDAVIVQDLGTAAQVERTFPDLPIHLSTQATVTHSLGAEFAALKQVKRVVLARELSIAEIAKMKAETTYEIEVFIHGALCYSYSGQCLMSSLIGGRSGNRGRCAQPCRLPYQTGSMQQAYLLSMKDLCALPLLPDLLEAGVDSLKIEGRMKQPCYTAQVVRLYRTYLDLYQKEGAKAYRQHSKTTKEAIQKELENCMEIYHRGGFTSGYLTGQLTEKMIDTQRPNHSGILVGKVVQVSKEEVTIRFDRPIYKQDCLEIRLAGKEIYTYTVKADLPSLTWKGIIPKRYGIKQGMQVYRMKNVRLQEQIQKDCADKKIPLSGEIFLVPDQPIRFDVHYQIEEEEKTCTVAGMIVQRAKQSPITKEQVLTQLQKTNQTPFYFTALHVQSQESVFVPISALNEIRRLALNQVQKEMIKRKERSGKTYAVSLREREQKQETRIDPTIAVLVETEQQFALAKEDLRIDCIYLELHYDDMEKRYHWLQQAKIANKKCYLALPPIFRMRTEQDMLQHREQFQKMNLLLDGYLFRNIASYHYLNKIVSLKQKDLVMDYSVSVMNQETKWVLHMEGLRYTSCIELNQRELQDLGCTDSDFVIYGYPRLMVTAQCMQRNLFACKKKKTVMTLQDRKQKNFYVKNNCDTCDSYVYNGAPFSLISKQKEIIALQPKYMRLDFSIESSSEMQSVLQQLYEPDPIQQQKQNKTTGHWKRGVE